MKIGTAIFSQARHGIMLIECLVYMALCVVLLGIATLALYRGLDDMRAMRRNADDIARALNAGELWRDDIRSASGPIRVVRGGEVIEIPHSQAEISYRFTGGQVMRKTGADARWLVFLSRVQHSKMTTDRRREVNAWRWELELKTSSRANVYVHPLFTFLAVPNSTSEP